MRWVAWVVGLTVAGAISARARAQPVVHVRAETRIELEVGYPGGRSAVGVGATLRDDQGNRLAGREVSVVVTQGGQTIGRWRGATDDRGHVAPSFPLSGGSIYGVEATFAGDELHEDVSVFQELDFARQHVRLTIGPVAEGSLGRLDLDQPEHRVRVTARSGASGGGSGLRVTVSSEIAELANGMTGSNGEAVLTLRSEGLGAPAAGRLIVRTSGDAERAPAQTEMLVVRYRETHLTLETNSGSGEERVRVRGVLSTSGGPLPRKAIGIFADDQHLETVLTGEDGSFEGLLDLGDDGAVSLQARFESDAPWRPEARSEPVSIRLAARSSTPFFWLLAPVLLCGVVLLILARRGARSVRETGRDSLAPAAPGIVSARRGGRDAVDTTVDGAVFDADEATPLGALIELRGTAGGLITAESDAEGAFRIEAVPAGRWTVKASVPGYEPREAQLVIPHRGEHRGIEVRLRSLRHLALRRYRPLAAALAPGRGWWGFWTPRELAGRANARLRGDVDGVTRAVEEAAYAAPHPAASDVDEIARRSADLADEIEP